MEEERVNRVNDLFDKMCNRLERDINNLKGEDLRYSIGSVLDLFAMKENLKNNEHAAMASERVMRTINSRIQRGEGGVQFGPFGPDGQPLPPNQPPQNPN